MASNYSDAFSAGFGENKTICDFSIQKRLYAETIDDKQVQPNLENLHKILCNHQYLEPPDANGFHKEVAILAAMIVDTQTSKFASYVQNILLNLPSQDLCKTKLIYYIACLHYEKLPILEAKYLIRLCERFEISYQDINDCGCFPNTLIYVLLKNNYFSSCKYFLDKLDSSTQGSTVWPFESRSYHDMLEHMNAVFGSLAAYANSDALVWLKETSLDL